MNTDIDIIIENGYNTSYLNNLLFALFYNDSVLERYILLENNSPNCDGLYIQQLILNNVIPRLKHNLPTQTNIINEIRLYSILDGWNNTKTLNDTYCLRDPFDYLDFLLHKINYHVIEYTNDNTNTTKNSNMIITTKIVLDVTDSICESYEQWCKYHTIINIPQFVILKIKLNDKNINVNEHINLFKNGYYDDLKWIFHGMIFNTDSGYASIVKVNNNLIYFDDNDFPNTKILDSCNIPNMKNKLVYIIYTKEPSV